MKNTLYIFFFVLFSFSQAVAQDPVIDSLKIEFKNAKYDTTRCNILNAMVEAENDDKIWPTFNEQLLKLAEKNTITTNKKNKTIFLKYFATALNNKGFIYDNQGIRILQQEY